MAYVAVTGDAVARTFAIPELLEQILIHAGQLELTTAAHLKFEPLKTMFVLRRVNLTFQSVISSSKTLRQFMLLDHDGDDAKVVDADLHGNLGPVWWLLNNMIDRNVRSELHDEVQVFNLSLDCRSKNKFFWWREQAFRTPCNQNAAAYSKASWRNIKLAHSPKTTRSAVLRQRVKTSSGPEGMHEYLIALNPQHTLGDVFAFYERIMRRMLRDLCRLSHISSRHPGKFEHEDVESLNSAEPLAADEAIVAYRKFKRAEKKQHSEDWRAEWWAEFKYKRWRENAGWIDVCAYCTEEEREEIRANVIEPYKRRKLQQQQAWR